MRSNSSLYRAWTIRSICGLSRSTPYSSSSLGGYWIREGHSPTEMVGSDTARMDNDPRCLQTTTPTADCKTGDRIRNIKLGEARPTFVMGFANDFQYKSLTLSSVWHWQQGGLVANLTTWLYDLSRNSDDYADDCAASGYPGCDPVGETVGEMRLRTYPSRVTATNVEDATFLKLRELTVTLDLPRSLIDGIWEGARHVRLSLSGRDLLRFTGYSGMDPEVANHGTNAIGRNQDVAPYPPSRSVWFSFNVGF